MTHTGWVAITDTGREIYEFQHRPGERRAWQQIRNQDQPLHLKTVLYMIDGGVLLSMPEGVDGYIAASRLMGTWGQQGTQSEEFPGIGFIHGETAVMFWVTSQGIWSELHPRDAMLPHAIMR